MDGFQTLASNRAGVCFSDGEETGAGSFAVAPTLAMKQQPAAEKKNNVLNEGGTFMPGSVTGSGPVRQAFRRGVSVTRRANALAITRARAGRDASRLRVRLRQRPLHLGVDFGPGPFFQELFPF